MAHRFPLLPQSISEINRLIDDIRELETGAQFIGLYSLRDKLTKIKVNLKDVNTNLRITDGMIEAVTGGSNASIR